MSNYLTTLFCSKVSELFKVDNTTTVVLLSTIAILSGIGFLIGDVHGDNYIAILAFASPTVWAIGFLAHGLEKLLEVIFNIPAYIKALNSLFGMWLWNYILLSFLFFDQTPTYPLEYTLIAPLVIEVWFLTSLIYTVNTRKELL